MKLLIFCIVFFILYLIFYLNTNAIHIDFKSFFRKGFQKVDNQFGLYCYTGKQGKGKTYSAIKFLIEQKLDNDYIIITNVHSFKVFQDTIYISSLDELIDLCIKYHEQGIKIIVFFDEIFTVINKSVKVDKKVLSFLSQLRKRSIILITTAQEWAEINLTFRRYVRYQVDCNMFSIPYFNYTAFIFNSINDAEQMKWDEIQQEHIAPRIGANFAKCNKSIVESYDTFETVPTNR